MPGTCGFAGAGGTPGSPKMIGPNRFGPDPRGYKPAGAQKPFMKLRSPDVDPPGRVIRSNVGEIPPQRLTKAHTGPGMAMWGFQRVFFDYAGNCVETVIFEN